ncbi:MAG: hypothetical protein VYE32_04420 [Candidatus Thermoplasmatota archaeon]|nr:hypothetical protein [Candidatus Thermoplasmatota archaeon]
MFDAIKSMPAKVCLGLSFLIGILYSINFIFFSSCSVVNGDADCFSFIPNGATPENEAYGRGAGTLYVAGVLMFGTIMGNLLILNEGARGKWTIMIPTIAGFTCLAIVLAPPFQGDYVSANNNPLYATIAALGLYTAAYVMLKEEGVDEGLAFNMGIKINNEAKYAIILSSFIGTLYSINHFFFADGYAGAGGSTLLAGFEEGSYWNDPIATTPIAYRVLASFFVIYVSMGLILLTNGAKGNWAAAHILLFGITFFALSIIIGNLVLNDQVIPEGEYAANSPYEPDNSTATANIAVSSLVMFLNIFAYYKMRDEGVEEGMTFGGEDFGNSDDFFYKMYPAVTAGFAVLLLIANFVTQPL